MNSLDYCFDDTLRASNFVRKIVQESGSNPDKIMDGLVLGSGLGGFSDEYLIDPIYIPYDDVYKKLNLPVCDGKVAGHEKKIVIARLKGDDTDRFIMALCGREHPYEGISGKRATFFLRVMQVLGVKTLLVSNAVGILTPQTLSPPALVLNSGNYDFAITDDNPLIGPNDERFGARFQHMSDQYPRDTRDVVKNVAKDLNIDLSEGILVRFKGPNYESPEDVALALNLVKNAWSTCSKVKGEDRFKGDPVGVVGMSSTYEARVAQHARYSKFYPAFVDARAFISVATNYSGSVGPDGFVEPSRHEEVEANAKLIQDQFGRLVAETILRMRK